MKPEDPRIRVLQHEIVTLRGLRIGPDIELADAAVKREREVIEELNKRHAEVEATNINAGGDNDEELPAAVSFSISKPKEDSR